MRREKHGVGGRWRLVAGLLLATLGESAVAMAPVPASGRPSDGDPVPADAREVRSGIEELCERLDSCRYAEAVGWDEHVTLLYERFRGRAPTTEELFLLRTLREEAHMSRGQSLSFVLRGPNPVPSWEQCRQAPAMIAESDLVHDLARSDRALRAALGPVDPIALSSTFAPQRTEPVPFVTPVDVELPAVEVGVEVGVDYEVYFGYLHAHTGLSDGQGTPRDAYAMARDAGLDFFAVTDHGELLLLWPWDNKWNEVLRTANAFNDPGTYVALWGFEWSHPLLGHVNVINSRDFTQILSHFWMRDLYDWIVARPGAFGRFNHPGRLDDFNIEFQHLERYDAVVRQMVGIETWNGSQGFGRFHYGGGWETDFTFLDEGNRNGWYLGPVGGQDNHSANWGEGGRKRTALLATGLTRRELLDAYRARRFYATEDFNLVLDLRCQGYPMGSRLVGGERTFRVTASDEGGDVFDEVRLYRNGELLEARAVAGETVDETFDDPARADDDYYYVIVRQTDDDDGDGRGDEALSAPIWVDR